MDWESFQGIQHKPSLVGTNLGKEIETGCVSSKAHTRWWQDHYTSATCWFYKRRVLACQPVKKVKTSACETNKRERQTLCDQQQTSKDVPIKLLLAGYCTKQYSSEDPSNSPARFVENDHNCQAHSWAVTPPTNGKLARRVGYRKDLIGEFKLTAL